jgi:hypothetical protein
MSLKQAHFPETTDEYNKRLDTVLHRIKYMNIKRWKILKSIVLSIAVLLFAGYAIQNGADATTVAVPAIITAGLIAGIELSEYLAVWAEAHSSIRENED